jgi:hypothetical protein
MKNKYLKIISARQAELISASQLKEDSETITE